MTRSHTLVGNLKVQELLRWSKLKQEQLSDAIFIMKNAAVDYLQRQAEKGNWREVQDVLHGKPLTKTGRFLMKELRNKIVGNLMLRLGLRRVVALAIAVVLLPLILAKVAGEVVGRVRNV